MCKGPIGKIIIGLLLIIAGLYAIIPHWLIPVTVAGIETGFAWDAFKTVLLGAIPPMIIIIGILIVWIEIEELKIEKMEEEIERELREEEEREEDKQKPRKSKRKRRR